MERACRALTNDGKNINPPLPDRLNWLTSARHIESYKSLKSKINTELHQSLCEDHEEYWRHQFHLGLGMHSIHSSSYYEEGQLSEQRMPIEPRSALIIYSFASWPEGKLDPIDSVDIQALIKEFDPMKGNTGLREYIKKFPKLNGET